MAKKKNLTRLPQDPFIRGDTMYVPVDVPLTFKDASTGNPTSWAWTFEGTDVTNSTEQNPTVSYLLDGTDPVDGIDLSDTMESLCDARESMDRLRAEL